MVSKTPKGMESLFKSSNKIESEGGNDKFTDSTEGTLFDWRYEWTVGKREGAYEICEKTYVSSNWFFVSSFFLIASLLCLSVIPLIESILLLIPAVLSAAFAFSYAYMVNLLIRYDSPLKDVFNNQPIQRGFLPYLSFLVASAPVFLLVPLLGPSGELQYVLMGMLLILTVYYVFREQVEDYSIKWQRALLIPIEQSPSMPLHYSFSLIEVSVVPFIFVLVTEIPVFPRYFDLVPYFAAILYVVLTLFFLNVFATGFRGSASFVRTRHKRYGSDTANKWVLGLSAVVSVFISFSFGYLFFQIFIKFDFLNSIAPGIPPLLIIGSSAIPILILISGFVYQLWSLLFGLHQVEQKMEQCDLGEDYQSTVSTYLLDYEGYFAGSVFLGWKEAIVVSEGLNEELSGEELDAIIAHEDSHIVEEEAKMTVLIGLLSPLILIGKNVVYVWLDYRSREYRADRYAKEATSPEQLVSALERLQILKANEKTDADHIRAVIPTMMPLIDEDEKEKGNSLIEVYFDYFFGDFAVSEVHPNLGDRVKRIRREEDSDIMPLD